MSEQKSSKLPWILLAIAIGATAAAGIVAAQQAEQARAAKVEADAAWDSASVLLQDLDERNERIPAMLDSMNAHWRSVLDSVTIVPVELSPTSPEVLAMLDKAAMSQALRAVVDTIMIENVVLRAQADTLRTTVVNLRLAAVTIADSINAFWGEQRARDMEVVAALQAAIVASREEANLWETAYYASRMSWLDRLAWGVGGAAVGYLANEFTGASVRVETCSCGQYYSMGNNR